MAGFVLKLLICPIAVIIASLLLPNVDFASWYQPIILGILLAVIGYFMEVLILSENTNLLSTALDFIVATAVVYFGAMMFAGTFVTLGGAVLTAAIITVTEIFQHNWLIQSGRTGKRPVSG